jgi:signal transduction histidine kinase
MKFVPLTHPSVDLTPASLGVMGLVLGCGLFRYDFLDVAPMASDILVAELPDPVFVLGEDGRILDHNRAAAVLFEAGSLSGRQIDEVAPGLTENVDGNAVYARPGTDRDEITYFDPRVTTIEDQHGIERGRLVVLRDVTGQQRRQDRLEALQAATRQFITANSAERIAELTVTFADRVLDQDAAAVYVHEPETDTLRVTAASDALEGHYSEATEVVDEPDHPLFETYRDGEIAVEDVTDDYPDTPFPHLLLVPIGDHGVLLIGSAERGAFVTEDEQFATILARTTQVALAQVERERELRQSRQSVERRNEQVEFFNGTLRHTLRNALLVIEGRANHLRDHVDNPRERHLDRIVQWCEDLAELSHDIDAINDTVSATEARQLDEIDLASVIRRRLDGLSQEFDDVEIELDIQGDATVRANDLVEKVVDSIVSNAITHNRAADPRVEITVHRIADRVQLRVADNGPGMGDEMKETVFERNVGTSQTSHGFGLYFVSVMMNLYGGTVWIEDNTDENGDCVGAVAVIEFQQGETQHTSRSAENEMS